VFNAMLNYDHLSAGAAVPPAKAATASAGAGDQE